VKVKIERVREQHTRHLNTFSSSVIARVFLPTSQVKACDRVFEPQVTATTGRSRPVVRYEVSLSSKERNTLVRWCVAVYLEAIGTDGSARRLPPSS
jgi:hypothetical protein